MRQDWPSLFFSPTFTTSFLPFPSKFSPVSFCPSSGQEIRSILKHLFAGFLLFPRLVCSHFFPSYTPCNFSILSYFPFHFFSSRHLKFCPVLLKLCFLCYNPPSVCFWSCPAWFSLYLNLAAYLHLLLWLPNLIWFQPYLFLMFYSLLDIIGAEFTIFCSKWDEGVILLELSRAIIQLCFVYRNGNSSFLHVS